MLHDIATEDRDLETLSLLAARRNWEVGATGFAGGMAALAVFLPGIVPENASILILAVLGILLLLVGSPLLLLWRSPPAMMRERIAAQITSRRAAGKPCWILSRTALVPLGLACFAFSYWLAGMFAPPL